MARRPTVLSGMNLTTLQNNLAMMQQAYLDISSGSKGESFSYTQGDGSKSVTYTRANLPVLISAIRTVQLEIDRQTGVRSNNGPLRPIF